MAYALYAGEGNFHIKYSIPIFCAGLFICCMLCHGELAMRKPAPQYLTLFYLMVSVGGAVGGIFVAIIAPARVQLLPGASHRFGRLRRARGDCPL